MKAIRQTHQAEATPRSRRSKSLASHMPSSPSLGAMLDGAGTPPGWIVYGRVSSEEQLEGTSLDNQKEICLSWLVSQGHQVRRVIMDEAASGKDLNRPGMRQLMADIESGRVQGVVISKLDRLSRDLKDTLHLIDLFDRLHVKFCCVRDPIDTSSACGRAFFQIRSTFAEFERGTISERQLQSIKYRRSKGLFTGGIVPLGMRATGPKGGRILEVDPVTGPIVAACWTKLLEGESLRDLAAYLTRANIPTRWKVDWSISTLSGLFHRKYPRGTLVDAETYDRAVRLLATKWSPTRAKKGVLAPEEMSPPNGVTEREWPLQSIARCGFCGAALVGTHGNGRGGRYYYLTCNGRQRCTTSICTAKPLSAPRWEAGVLRAVTWLADQEELLAETLARYARERQSGVEPAMVRQRAITPERDRLQDERDRLIDVAKSGAVVARAVAPALGEIQTKLDAIETVLADLRAQIADASLGDRGVEALLPELRLGLASLNRVPEANRNLVLRELATRIDLGQGLPMTLHLRLPGTSNDPIKKIVPPNQGSEGRTQWCPGKDSNLHIFKGY